MGCGNANTTILHTEEDHIHTFYNVPDQMSNDAKGRDCERMFWIEINKNKNYDH